MTDASTQGRRGAGTWRRWAAICGLAALAACTTIAEPLRPAIYGYSLIVSDTVVGDTTIGGVDYFAGDTVTDTVDFHWPASALPVRIWVQDTVGLPGYAAAAIAEWKHILQYGELDAVLVGDSATADIIVVRGSAPASLSGARPVPQNTPPAPAACDGTTLVFISAPDHTKLWLPVRVYVLPKYPVTLPETQACLARVTMHELGHAFGLFKHSTDTLDLMYGFPDVDAPSEADAATILILYHQASDLTPRPATDTLPGGP